MHNLVEVLHMNGGIGDISYANNSLVQRKAILMTKPIRAQAMSDLYCNLLPETFCIADLGCASGSNTFLVISELVKTIERERKKHGLQSPEFHFLFNDLPSNDFNNIFQSLGEFEHDLRNQIGEEFGQCFFSGVAGSFYTRLFPSKSLHFVHSSFSLQWLSQVPDLIEKNKGNIYMSSSSPPSVIRAYYKQFEKDFSNFLKYRSEELMKGGKMVLTILGRESEDPSSKEGCYIWELLSMVLNELVIEGLIEEEKLDSFNIPNYTPSPAEVKYIVEKEGSFTINRLETTRVHWNNASNNNEKINGGYDLSRCMRAVAEPLLVSQFGPKLMDLVFQKYEEIISYCMSKEKTEFINVTVYLTKKKGLIEEEKLDSFNIPIYSPSPAEVKYIVEKEGSFTINRLETTRVHWNNASNNNNENNNNGGYNFSRCIRAVAEPLLVSHFGPKLMDLVFQKYEEIVSECMSKEKTEFINVTVSLTKK